MGSDKRLWHEKKKFKREASTALLFYGGSVLAYEGNCFLFNIALKY